MYLAIPIDVNCGLCYDCVYLYMAKETLVVPTDQLVKNGLIPPPEQSNGKYTYNRIKNLGDLRRLLRISNSAGKFQERFGANGVETDPSMQQIIMYGFVQRNDGRFLLYQRGEEGKYDESRVAGKVSVGIGGHMEPIDFTLITSFYRELDEEAEILVDGEPLNTRDRDGKLNIPLIKKYIRVSPIGLIKDGRDKVGMMHIGVVCKIVPKAENVTIGMKTESGESVSYIYIDTETYRKMQQTGQINPEGWTDIIVKEELTPKA